MTARTCLTRARAAEEPVHPIYPAAALQTLHVKLMTGTGKGNTAADC